MEGREKAPRRRDHVELRDRDPSRYVKRSAQLPHLGEDADRAIIDSLATLRKSARVR